MYLKIASIAIVDLTNKESRKISFSEGKNLLTSSQNHLGKSVVMKSIYYTLGAEVHFPHPIKQLNLLTYIDFNMQNCNYRVCRLNRMFTLYCEGKYVGKYSSVDAFGEMLSKLYKLEINLVGKNQDGTIEKCPPAFYYTPYYIDQENGWAPNSYSFARMTQFDLPQRKNSYFFHLGVFDNAYVQSSKQQKSNSIKISHLTRENEKYATVIDTLQLGINGMQMSFDVDSLQQAIESRKNEIDKILDELTKSRNNLVKTEDALVQLNHDKDILKKYITKRKTANVKLDTDSEVIECPKCGMFFERELVYRLEKEYLFESLNEDYTNILEEQIKLERKVEKLKQKFIEKQNILTKYESSLETDQETYNIYMKFKATGQLLKEYREGIIANMSEIERLQNENSRIKKQINEYIKEKNQTNKTYLNNFGKLLIDLDIPKGQVNEESEPGSALVASGAYGPRCKIAQMLAFLQTQNNVSPNIISFPLVIDSPNALEQDNEHLETVIKTLLTWDKTDNQIIVASISGIETASKIPGVRIISLTNPQNHLLSKEEYQQYESEITEIYTRY